MVLFPNAKINIGLQVLGRRPDGYHDLETVFYPLNIHDALEVVEADELQFFPSGLAIPDAGGENLCLKAYRLLRSAYDLPPVAIYLHKVIPIGAGLGGGSSDAAFMLKALDAKFSLGLGEAQLIAFASQLGADCAFFVRNTPVFATGIGNVFTDVALDLSAYRVVLAKPAIHVSTAEAYRLVESSAIGQGLAQAIAGPVSEWRDTIRNDFEAGLFRKYPEIGVLKDLFYEQGAIFAAMSGSGSSVYGLFEAPVALTGLPSGCSVFYVD